VSGKGWVYPAGVQGDTALGQEEAQADANVVVSGVIAVCNIDNVTVIARGTCKVFPTGVSAQCTVSSTLVWGLIDDNQTPNWQNVNDSQTSNWVQVNDGNTVLWVQIPT
jgi:hypothetical protein